MPPDTPTTTCRPAHMVLHLRAPAPELAEVELAGDQLPHREGRQLHHPLVLRPLDLAVPGEFVEVAREPRRDQDGPVLGAGIPRGLGRREDLHVLLLPGGARAPESFLLAGEVPPEVFDHRAQILEAAHPTRLAVQYRGDVGHRLHHVVVHDHIIVRIRRQQLLDGDVEPAFQVRPVLGAACPEALDQHRRRGWQHEDLHRIGKPVPDLAGAVHPHLEHDVAPGTEPLLHLFPQRAVEVPGVFGPFHEGPGRHALLELPALQEVILPPVLLALAPLPRRGRDRIGHVFARVQQVARDGGLSAPRGRGDHQQERTYSKFSSCSRNRSSSPFMATTACCMTASFAFEPIVFASRPSSWARKPSRLPPGRPRASAWPASFAVERIVFASRPSSWARKPSRLPTGPSRASASAQASRCASSRTSSSVTSSRSARKAISWASRCSSTGRPLSSWATAARSRSRSRTTRSGARALSPCASVRIRARRSPSSAASTAPSRRRASRHCLAASATTGSRSAHCAGPASVSAATKTSGCRATSSSGISPDNPAAACSSRSRAVASRARSALTAIVPAGLAGGLAHRTWTATWPRSNSRRSRSRSSRSNPARSAGSLAAKLKCRWLTERISTRSVPPATGPSAAPNPVMLNGRSASEDTEP